MWTKLNQIMFKHEYIEPNFKGFMVDITQASWNAVKIVYGSGDATIRMVDKERTCLFHWTQLLDRHTKQLIKPKIWDQYKALCFDYKNSKFLEEVDT